MTPNALRELAPGVHVVDAAQRFVGMEVGTRMTVLQLEGGLLVCSPIALDPGSVAHLGTLRWVLAPNLFHHLYLRPWAETGAELWGAAGLPKKRPDIEFRGVVEEASHPFGDEVQLLALSCFPFTNEVVVFHQPSGTLIVADLVFNIPATAPWGTRATMRALGGYPGCRTTLVERFGMKREPARREVSEITSLDFDRLVMAHGDVIETGGRAALRNAFGWLGLG